MLIVETLLPGGIATQFGLNAGDCLRAYNGAPLTSPAMLDALSENSVGDTPNSLDVSQQGQERTLFIPSGSLGLEARPVLSPEVETLYREGFTVWQADSTVEASRLWQEAIRQASEPLVIAWLEMLLGNRYEKKNHLQEALSAYDRAWKILRATDEYVMQYLCLTERGKSYLSLSDFSQSENCYRSALKLTEAMGYLIWKANCLNRLSAIAWKRGNLASMEDYNLQAFQILQRLAPDSLPMAGILYGLGSVEYQRGNLQAAEDLYRRSLEIRERLAPKSLDVAYTLNYLGNVAYQRGDLSKAEDLYQRALTTCEHLAPESLGVATCLLSLAIVADARGDLPTAEDFNLRGLAILEHSAPNSLDVARTLNNMGVVAIKRGDLSSAEDYQRRSLEIRERLAPGSMDVALSLINLGNVAKERGDLATAEDFYRRCLEIRERLAPGSLDVSRTLNNLGIIAMRRENLSSAEDFYRRSLEIRERLAPNSLDIARTLNNLGIIAMRRGDLSSAEDFYRRSLEIKERLAPNSLDVAVGLHALGNMADMRGDLSIAEDLYRSCVEIRERLAPNSLDMATILHELAGLYRKQQPQQALPLHLRALAIIENQRIQIASVEGRSLLLAQYLDRYLGLLRTYLALGDTAKAFAVVERARARSLVEMLAERQLDFSRDAPTELLQREQEINQQRVQIYSTLARFDANADAHQLQSLQTQLQDLERQQQQLTARIRQASPRYAGLQYPQPLDLTGVQAMLDPGTLALVYQTDQTQTYLFAVTKERCDLHLLPIGREQLTQKITTFRKVLDVRLLENTIKQAVLQGQELHASLLAPVQAALKRARRLLLCPEGPLLMLPFACLVTNTARTPRYLGEATPIHQAVSLTVYAQARQEKREARERKSVQQASTHFVQSSEGVAGILQAGKRLLALGDPLYPQTSDRQAAGAARSQDPEVSALRSRGMSLTPLPHTRQEVEGIGRLFGEQASLHLDAEATKTIAKEESAHAAIIHFACHAWLDHRFPLSSALVLSQPELLGEQTVGGDNGLLQAWEVMEQMKLEADLVVLSACETGLGQEVRGEGLVGLTRAFQYAGASSVLASLWEINDASTSAFMQAFYEALVAGESKDVSVQRGIQQLRKHPEWGHPYYWGAFALQGDWD